ncbi:MAG TPA: carboxypeptidase regulatory-like domain-containing protein [Terriglobia bacterium]|nr:carboxypeptidase regulatory-like domain-containing protein [Terriglobia bacterium]
MISLLARCSFVFALLCALTAHAQSVAPRLTGEAASQARLPVTRVVLYKNGVGYFEHSTQVRGTQELNIDFTTAQLNDVLNSLTVVDLGQGRIANVRFNSLAPLAERLRALHLSLGEQSSRADLLEALRGTRVEVRDGSLVTAGRVFSTETRRTLSPKGDALTEVTQVALISDSGDLRTIPLEPSTSVRIADRDVSDELSRYLSLIASSKAQDVRRMTISDTGEGERSVFVSYISEVPVWKSTYRILLPQNASDKPIIQGWAIVDNTLGEDWRDVRLSLVAGSPQSFIQPISQPYYLQRPVVGLPQSATLTPQTHEAAMMPEGIIGGVPGGVPGGSMSGVIGGIGRAPAPGGIGSGVGGGVYDVGRNMQAFAKLFRPGMGGVTGVVRDASGAAIPNVLVTLLGSSSGAAFSARSDSSGRYQIANAPPGPATLTASAPGFQSQAMGLAVSAGSGTESDIAMSVGGVAETVGIENAVPGAIEGQQSQVESSVGGREAWDLFEYDIKQSVTIAKNQSALVPILQGHVEAEKVTLWNEGSAEALRALWVNNTSGETLDSGSFNILEGGAFAGQGLLDTLHAGEKRLVSYAADPAVQVRVEADASQKPVSLVVINKGVMRTTHELRETKTYRISNSDVTLRDVVIEHPARDGWTLASQIKPDESSASFHRFKVNVGPHSGAKLVVEEVHPESSETALTNLDASFVELLTKQDRMTPAMSTAFRRVLDQKAVIAGLEAQIGARQTEVNSIENDQQRLRENMKALKGSPEERALVERYTHQLNSQEDRLATLHGETAALQKQREEAGNQLDNILNEISLKESF